jgi:aldehyde dehydrogenase (NAD+)
MAVTQAISITRHPYADGSYKKMLIDGKWVDAASGKKFETFNPATGEVLATVAEGDAEDINRAVAAARRAFEGPWSKVKPFERAGLLLKLAELVERDFEELSQLDTLDMGAPISRTRANKLRVLGMLRYYAGQATSIHGETIENSLPGEIFSYTLKEPVGVVGAIIPWNGPLGASVWKIGPAIATGCTVVLKPAEEAPLTPLRLAELCLEAGIPPGVVNVVPGYGETAGAALASHPGVDKVAFTGSHLTGQSIVRASAGNLKRVSLELGGKSPDIVFADADLDAAVPGAAMAVFANSGQICSAGTRLFVESKIYDEFVGRVAEFGKKLNVGNGLDPNTQIGPLVSKEQLERVSGYLDVGQKEGAKALAGGARLTEGALSKGYFVPPTVFANVQDNMRIAQEEIFGPVISAISFKDSDDLIKRANATTFRPRLRRMDHQCQQGAPGRKGAARRLGLGQLLPGDGSGGALRRLQDERLWPRVRQAARGGVSQREGGLGEDGLRLFSPLPACGERPTREARRVRGSLREGGESWTRGESPSPGSHSASLHAIRPLPACGARRRKNLPPYRPLRLADVAAQRGEFLAHCGRCVTLDLAVARDQRVSERRQRGAAAVLAAGLALHRRLAADAVDLVDEIPGTLVRHVHGAAGRRDRTELADFLQ